MILTLATSYALVLHRATTSIPIVMVSSGYPVEAGLAASLAKPGKNVTGNSLYAGVEVWGKYLQLLIEVKPGGQPHCDFVGVFAACIPEGGDSAVLHRT